MQAFRLFDRDGDGTITVDEITQCVKLLGVSNVDSEIIHEMMREVDVDQSGEVQFDDFCILMKRMMAIDQDDEEMRGAFKVFDRNGDEKISKDELRHMLINLGEYFEDDEIDSLMTSINRAQNNQINYEEFKLYTMMVQNLT